MSTVKLELDFAGTFVEGPQQGVDLAVVNPCGPAGGWPVVAVTGTSEALHAWLLAEYVAGDEAQARELLDTATPVS